jgi:hypothetical protein
MSLWVISGNARLEYFTSAFCQIADVIGDASASPPSAISRHRRLHSITASAEASSDLSPRPGGFAKSVRERRRGEVDVERQHYLVRLQARLS